MAKKGKATNFLVWIILGLLVVGLAGFGTVNFTGTVRDVATVGETQISITTYGRALQQELRAQGESRGEPLTMAEAQAQGIDTAVLQNLLAAAALEEAARQAGISVGDERVSAQIVAIPAFQGIDGKFDREAYEFALDRAGLSVAEFESSIRAELARNLMQVAMVQGIAPQPAYADTIYSYLGESRTVSFAALTEDNLDSPVALPTDAEVQAYYDENSASFTLPGYKAITYAWLTPDMLVPTIDIDEADLRDEYELRSDEFNVPARRLVERLGFPDEAAAQAAMDAINAGETDFDALLADRDLTIEDVDLGFVTEGDLGDAGSAIFALEDTGVTGPLPSPVGPALFRINAILNPQTTSFEDARETLRADLARDRAADILADDVEPLNDLLAGGATLEDLVAESDMELGQIDWTGPAEGIASYDAFNTAADAVTADDFPEIMVAEDGTIFALRLDDTVAPRVPPLEDVREEVTAATRAAAVRAALNAQAESLVTQLAEGASFEDLGLTATTRDGITRRSGAEGLPAATLETIFALEPGAATLVDAGAQVIVLRLDSVTQPDQNAPNAQALRTAMTEQAAQSMAQEVLATMSRAIEAEAGISIDQAALNAVHAQIQ